MSTLALTFSRREWIVELLLLLAESMLVWMAAAVLFAPFTSAANPAPLPLVMALVALAGVLPRILHDRGIWGGRFSAGVIVAVVLSTAATIKLIAFPGLPWSDPVWAKEAARSLAFEDSNADVLVWAPVALSAVVWWLPRFHGASGLERSRATLRIGAAVAAISTIGASFVQNGPDDRSMSAAIVVFFASTLLALALSRQGSGATHSRHRLGSTVMLPTVVIGIAAALGALLVTRDWERAVPRSLPSLGAVLDPVFSVLMLLLTGIVFIIALPIMWLLSLGNYDTPRVMEFAGFQQGEASQATLGWHPPDPVRYLLATIVLIAIFFGVVRFGLAVIRRDFEREETGQGALGPGKRRGKWLDRFRWPFGRDRSDPLAELRGDPAWEQTVRVRETYAAWLRWAAHHGFGRDIAETALELDHRSSPHFDSPASAVALEELTIVYNDVRYSQTPATSEQAERAASALRRLKSSESPAARTQ